MPNPQFTKPWHGVPRADIHWNPTIIEDACIGCGTCVTGCSRLVYRFDFERKKPVVIDPLNCMVGCTTCANTCPAHAIEFPSLASVLALEGRAEVRHAIEDDVLARHDILASPVAIPHPDRIISLRVEAIDRVTPEIMRVILAPQTVGECFCEFMPGQYIELWQPDSTHLSRAYSIANAPHGDGRIELHIRHAEGGRFTSWAFTDMKIGDRLQARGPLGQFTMRSAIDMPLLFVAGGTGLAPVMALLEQQVNLFPGRDMVLLWGMRRTSDFYALDSLRNLLSRANKLSIILVAEVQQGEIPANEHLVCVEGDILSAIRQSGIQLQQRDIYAAGPMPMLRVLARHFEQQGVEKQRLHLDSFGA